MIARELETDVFYGYRLLPLLLSEEVIDMSQLRAGTGTAICPSAGGSYPDYQNAMRKDKVAGTICKL